MFLYYEKFFGKNVVFMSFFWFLFIWISHWIDCSFYDEQIANLQEQIAALKASAEWEKVGIARNLENSWLSPSAIANSVAWVDQRYQSQITSIEWRILSLQQQKLNCMYPSSTSTSSSSVNCNNFNWASLYADDWTFLWVLNNNSYDTNSIANKYGNYGNVYSSKSIFNNYWTYGSRYNSLSPWNKYSSRWPTIKKNWKTIWILTLNQYKNWAQNPFDVISCFIDRSDDRWEDFEDLYENWHWGTTSLWWYDYYNTPTTLSDEDYSDYSCKLKYWSNSIVDPTDSNYCICKKWYTRNSAGTSCITEDQSCKNKYWNNSYAGNDNLCYCKDWYGWDTTNKTSCVSMDKSCKWWYWNNSYAGSDDLCYCKDWYEWNTSMTSCVKKSTTNNENSNTVLPSFFTDAYNYAYSKWITTMDSMDKADMNWTLDRIAMAKMIWNYAINALWIQPDTTKSCYFPDVSSTLNTQYDNWVTKACQLGLMWQGITQFRPRDKVSRAEFATVLSRLLNRNSSQLNDMNKATPYYSKHMQYLKDNWIIDNIVRLSDYDNEIRWYVMLMLMRSDENYVAEGGCTSEEFLACFNSDELDACLAACSW